MPNAKVVVIPNTVKKLCVGAFTNAKNLKTVLFEDGCSLWGIEAKCFQNSSIEEIEIPDSVVVIGQNAFQGCAALKGIMLSSKSKLQKVLSFAFSGTALTSFSAPPDLREIHSLAFYNCKALSSVTLSANVTHLGELCFLNTAVKSVKLPPIQDISDEYLGIGRNFSSVYVVPDGTSVISSSMVNYGCNVVVVPNSVTKLSDQAFKGYFNLKRVVFQEGSQVQDIGYYCFSDSNIEYVNIPKSIKMLKCQTFYNCKALKHVTLNEGLTTLDQNSNNNYGVFQNSGLEDVTLPNTLTYVGNYAFSYCPNLRSVRVQNDSQLSSIGNYAFSNSGVQSITFPKTLSYVGSDAFQNCGGLATVYVESGCKITASKCVNSSVKITEIPPLPSRDIMVANTPLWSLRALKSLVLPDSIDKIGDFWFAGSDVEEVTIPENVTEIGAQAFCSCPKLRRVVFAQNSKLKTLRKSCFQDSALEDLTLPPNVTDIEAGAFYNCKSLRSATLNEGLEVLCRNENGN